MVARKYDLILTGKSSSDNNLGFVGLALTTFMGWNQLYNVYKLIDNKADQLDSML